MEKLNRTSAYFLNLQCELQLKIFLKKILYNTPKHGRLIGRLYHD